jgi:hypothetical protein
MCTRGRSTVNVQAMTVRVLDDQLDQSPWQERKPAGLSCTELLQNLLEDVDESVIRYVCRLDPAISSHRRREGGAAEQEEDAADAAAMVSRPEPSMGCVSPMRLRETDVQMEMNRQNICLAERDLLQQHSNGVSDRSAAQRRRAAAAARRTRATAGLRLSDVRSDHAPESLSVRCSPPCLACGHRRWRTRSRSEHELELVERAAARGQTPAQGACTRSTATSTNAILSSSPVSPCGRRASHTPPGPAFLAGWLQICARVESVDEPTAGEEPCGDTLTRSRCPVVCLTVV